MQTDCQSPTEECDLAKAGSAARQLWAAHAQPDGMETAARWLSGPDPLRGVPVEVLLDQGLRRPLLLQVHALASPGNSRVSVTIEPESVEDFVQHRVRAAVSVAVKCSSVLLNKRKNTA